VRVSIDPDTSRVRLAEESSWMVMPVLEAVKGPTVWGVPGRLRGTPAAGTGDGMGKEMSSGPTAMWPGVAPLASTWAVALPEMEEFPRAAAALTIEEGRFTTVW